MKTCTDDVEVGHTGPLRPSDMGRPIPHLERVLLDFPELVVVGGHIGAPWLDEMIFLANKCFGQKRSKIGTAQTENPTNRSQDTLDTDAEVGLFP